MLSPLLAALVFFGSALLAMVLIVVISLVAEFHKDIAKFVFRNITWRFYPKMVRYCRVCYASTEENSLEWSTCCEAELYVKETFIRLFKVDPSEARRYYPMIEPAKITAPLGPYQVRALDQVWRLHPAWFETGGVYWSAIKQYIGINND